MACGNCGKELGQIAVKLDSESEWLCPDCNNKEARDA